jgi:hypothetical protein
MKGIPEEEKENAVELTPMNLYTPMVDKETKWQKRSLQIEVPDPHGVIFVLGKKIDFRGRKVEPGLQKRFWNSASLRR